MKMATRDPGPVFIPTSIPPEFKYDVERAGSEVITVGETKYDCAIFKSTSKFGTRERVCMVWKAAGAPCWAMKQTWTVRDDLQVVESWTEEFTGTEKVKVGDRELACLVLKKTTADKKPRIEMEWLCAEVPGGRVKWVAFTATEKGEEVKGTRFELELTGFEKK